MQRTPTPVSRSHSPAPDAISALLPPHAWISAVIKSRAGNGDKILVIEDGQRSQVWRTESQERHYLDSAALQRVLKMTASASETRVNLWRISGQSPRFTVPPSTWLVAPTAPSTSVTFSKLNDTPDKRLCLCRFGTYQGMATLKLRDWLSGATFGIVLGPMYSEKLQDAQSVDRIQGTGPVVLQNNFNVATLSWQSLQRRKMIKTLEWKSAAGVYWITKGAIEIER